ncbi:MAG: hypothetical protein LH629_11705 [Ignavibacteria bacterium]|nr:hypothetical protein [Ignavibacteria bacterium]
MPNKAVISSNIAFENEGLNYISSLGTYTVVFRISHYTSGCIVVGIEDDSKRMTSNYWSDKPSLCVTCKG